CRPGCKRNMSLASAGARELCHKGQQRIRIEAGYRAARCGFSSLCEMGHEPRRDQALRMRHAQEGVDMRSFSFSRLRTSDPAGSKRWSYRAAVLAVSLGFLGLAAIVIAARSDREARAAPASAITNASSGGGNLVPVF